MAHHDFINQAANTILSGAPLGQLISRGLWSGLDISTIEALLQTAQELAAE